MKKIGLLCLALVLALGTLGVAYAMWWDEVTIEGTVNTGSVEISIEGLSETYVYKNVTSREMVMSYEPLVGADLLLVASATAEDVSQAGGPKKVQMTFTNIFPTCEPIAADVLLHYTGSVPAHVVLLEDDVDGSIAPYLVQTWFVFDGEEFVEQEIDGIQLHYCDLVWLVVYLDPVLLQEDGKDAQGLSGNFTKTVIVHQWNEAWQEP
jgi:hypothetical protein